MFSYVSLSVFPPGSELYHSDQSHIIGVVEDVVLEVVVNVEVGVVPVVVLVVDGISVDVGIVGVVGVDVVVVVNVEVGVVPVVVVVVVILPQQTLIS